MGIMSDEAEKEEGLATPAVGHNLHDTIVPGMEIIKGKWSLMRQDIIPCGLMERTFNKKFPVNLGEVIFFPIHVQLPVHIQQE